MNGGPAKSPLFPYTTLFRSEGAPVDDPLAVEDAVVHGLEEPIVDFGFAGAAGGDDLRVMGRFDDGMDLGSAATTAQDHQAGGAGQVGERLAHPEAVAAMNDDGGHESAGVERGSDDLLAALRLAFAGAILRQMTIDGHIGEDLDAPAIGAVAGEADVGAAIFDFPGGIALVNYLSATIRIFNSNNRIGTSSHCTISLC